MTEGKRGPQEEKNYGSADVGMEEGRVMGTFFFKKKKKKKTFLSSHFGVWETKVPSLIGVGLPSCHLRRHSGGFIFCEGKGRGKKGVGGRRGLDSIDTWSGTRRVCTYGLAISAVLATASP